MSENMEVATPASESDQCESCATCTNDCENNTSRITLDEATAKDVFDVWYKGEPESIDKFIEELHANYNHDYGTICHAMSAVAVQAARKFNKGDQGGITGFQAGAVMWEFIKKFMHLEGPMKLVQYENMLYPQYFSKFDQVISTDVWKYLQEQAAKKIQEHLEDKNVHPDVLIHWQKIVDGHVPFGYVVQNDE
jgi:hypothetical protein